jgi:predicted enzyme related to lactoylglutathione lyase
MMGAVSSDRLRVLLTCAPSQFEAVASFYGEALGFEVEHRRTDESGQLAGLRRDGTRVLLATPGAMGIGASEPTKAATLILMHPDVAAHRRALEARFSGQLGPLREMGDGRFYAIDDPAGNAVWIMQVE